MNELEIFRSDEFGEIRTVVINGEPWFVGKDVAEALGYKDTADAIRKHVDDEDKYLSKVGEIPTLKSSNYGVFLINESGVYSLVFGSKLESAKRFKRWVTHEVLPTLRKTGSYTMSTDEKIQVLAQSSIETNKKIEEVKKDLEEFKMEMPLMAVDCETITKAKRKKIFELLGGKNSRAYNDNALRSKCYRDLERQMVREFGVGSYKAIQRNKIEKVVEFIENYKLPGCLLEEIQNLSNQMRLEDM